MMGVYIILILLGVAVGAILYRPARRQIVGICSFAIEQTTQKQRNKKQILSLLQEQGELANEDIREALGVSRRSVARYMTQLEKEGLVEQMGDIGRGVTYRILEK